MGPAVDYLRWFGAVERQEDNDGLLCRSVVPRARAGVHKQSVAIAPRPIILVYVTEDVQAGRALMHLLEQVLATSSKSIHATVTNPLWWPVRDKHVQVGRDLGPLLLHLLTATIQIEPPVTKLWLPRRSEYFY